MSDAGLGSARRGIWLRLELTRDPVSCWEVFVGRGSMPPVVLRREVRFWLVGQEGGPGGHRGVEQELVCRKSVGGVCSSPSALDGWGPISEMVLRFEGWRGIETGGLFVNVTVLIGGT